MYMLGIGGSNVHIANRQVRSVTRGVGTSEDLDNVHGALVTPCKRRHH